MSLVKFEDKQIVPTWNKRDNKATRHKIPGDAKKPIIDYDKLRQLCAIEGLKGRKNGESTEEAHRAFMESYKNIFVEDEPKKGLPYHSLSRSLRKASESSLSSRPTSQSVVLERTLPDISKPTEKIKSDDMSHDIRDYMGHLHKQRKSEDPKALKTDRIKTLRKLLKKLPFERSAGENDQIFNAIKHFDVIAGQFPKNVLKELCVVAQLDAWKESDLTVFGNTGFHFILRGKVKPLSDPWVKFKGEDIEFPPTTPEPTTELERYVSVDEVSASIHSVGVNLQTAGDDLPESLGIGDCFGTFEKVEDREPNTKILSVMTMADTCEFFRISTSDYKRVIEQIRQRDETEKVNLLQACRAYHSWSKQPLVKVANLLEWVSFPANTVLVSEGYKSPFGAIIKKGECHVLRQVEVLKSLPDGRKEKKTKQVAMGKLCVNDSFGAISIITEEPITCSIVTATSVELAVIEPEKLKELDETTVQLLQQSSEKTFDNLTKDDIHNEYVEQELKREWNEFKHNAVVDVINHKGIRPGYGKWAKN